MQLSFIYRQHNVTIQMRRDQDQWIWRQKLDGTVLGEGQHIGTAQRALHEAVLTARQKVDERLIQADTAVADDLVH